MEKINFEKLRTVEKKLEKALEVKGGSLKEIAEHTNYFEYIQSESMDDDFEFKVRGVEFSKIHEEFLECVDDEPFIDKALDMEFEEEIDELNDNWDGDLDLSPEQVKIIKRMLLNVQAKVISDIEEELSDWRIDEIARSIKAIESEVEGFKYDEWEETTILLSVDGLKYRYNLWGELADAEEYLTIDELEEKYNKLNRS